MRAVGLSLVARKRPIAASIQLTHQARDVTANLIRHAFAHLVDDQDASIDNAGETIQFDPAMD